MGNSDKELGIHTFGLGESLYLTTKYYSNGDTENNVYTTQELTLHSSFDDATFNLCGSTFSPATLRRLADEMEEYEKKFDGSGLRRRDKVETQDTTEKELEEAVQLLRGAFSDAVGLVDNAIKSVLRKVNK